MVGGVAPVIALRPRRSRKQADPFIVADRLDLGRRCLGEVADGQASLGHHPLTLLLLQGPYWEPIFLCNGRTTVDRKSVVEGKRVEVRVDLGGRRIFKKKKKQ